MMEDIGESKRYQQLLQQEVTRFQGIVENMSVGATFCEKNDGSGPIRVYCNRAVEEMLGYAREELSTLQAWLEIIWGKEVAPVHHEKYIEEREKVRRKSVRRSRGAVGYGSGKKCAQKFSRIFLITRASLGMYEFGWSQNGPGTSDSFVSSVGHVSPSLFPSSRQRRHLIALKRFRCARFEASGKRELLSANCGSVTFKIEHLSLHSNTHSMGRLCNGLSKTNIQLQKSAVCAKVVGDMLLLLALRDCLFSLTTCTAATCYGGASSDFAISMVKETTAKFLDLCLLVTLLRSAYPLWPCNLSDMMCFHELRRYNDETIAKALRPCSANFQQW